VVDAVPGRNQDRQNLLREQTTYSLTPTDKFVDDAMAWTTHVELGRLYACRCVVAMGISMLQYTHLLVCANTSCEIGAGTRWNNRQRYWQLEFCADS
jgi:hypothetical protein